MHRLEEDWERFQVDGWVNIWLLDGLDFSLALQVYVDQLPVIQRNRYRYRVLAVHFETVSAS